MSDVEPEFTHDGPDTHSDVEDGPPLPPEHVRWYTADAPSARGLSRGDALREQIAELEAARELMPYETTEAGVDDILAALRSDLAAIEDEEQCGDDPHSC